MIIEKGTIDGILNDNTVYNQNRVKQLLLNCNELLAMNGTILIFSHTDTHINLIQHTCRYWMITIHKLLYSPTALLFNRLQQYDQQHINDDVMKTAMFDVRHILEQYKHNQSIDECNYCYVYQCTKN